MHSNKLLLAKNTVLAHYLTIDHLSAAAKSAPPEEKILQTVTNDRIRLVPSEVRGGTNGWHYKSLFYKHTVFVKRIFPYRSDQEYIRRESIVLRIALCKRSLKSTEVKLCNIAHTMYLSTHKCLAW